MGDDMKLAYFMNTYPVTSTTFIRREIEAHEQAGCNVERFAIRPWDQELIDPRDIEEKEKTNYLLGQGVWALFRGFFHELFRNPSGVAKAARLTLKMFGAARNNRVKQFAYLLEAVSLKQKMAAAGIDHIHTHFSTNSASVVLLAHVMGGASYSMMVHGPDELFEMTENLLNDKVEKARFVTAITDYCKKTVDDHTRHEFTEKIHVVRCGLDLDEFTGVEDISKGNQLVCVGRICKAKGQELLVEALAEIRDDFPDVHLVLVGDGEERATVEQRISSLNLEDNVTLVGWASNAKVRAIIAQSRVLVLPSFAEGLPIVLMESLALGRPVVTTAIYGIPELVDSECGWLLQPGDKEALVKSLAEVLTKEPDALSAMAQKGRKRVFEQHDQVQNAKQLRQLFLDYRVGAEQPVAVSKLA